MLLVESLRLEMAPLDSSIQNGEGMQLRFGRRRWLHTIAVGRTQRRSSFPKRVVRMVLEFGFFPKPIKAIFVSEASECRFKIVAAVGTGRWAGKLSVDGVQDGAIFNRAPSAISSRALRGAVMGRRGCRGGTIRETDFTSLASGGFVDRGALACGPNAPAGRQKRSG